MKTTEATLGYGQRCDVSDEMKQIMRENSINLEGLISPKDLSVQVIEDPTETEAAEERMPVSGSDERHTSQAGVPYRDDGACQSSG